MTARSTTVRRSAGRPRKDASGARKQFSVWLAPREQARLRKLAGTLKLPLGEMLMQLADAYERKTATRSTRSA